MGASSRKPLVSQLFAPKPTPAPVVDENRVLPKAGVILPVVWKDLGIQLIKSGVIDRVKFDQLYAQRGGLGEDAKLLDSADNTSIRITPQNSNLILNLLWAFGLANKNSALAAGPMVDKQYGGAGNFASTGGWTLSKGSAMSHYSKYRLVPLTLEQDELVAKVAKTSTGLAATIPPIFPTAIMAWPCWGCSSFWRPTTYPSRICTKLLSRSTPIGSRTPI